MDYLNRYRNLMVLSVAILVQLILLAYQVRNDQEIRLIRVWAVGGVTPVARLLDSLRSGTSNFFGSYIIVRDAREDNKRLQSELDQARMEIQHLRTQLDTAANGQALALFQAQTPMKTVAARVIGNTTSAGSKEMMIDRGASSGILRGMAVITPAGIAGKVTRVYPDTSYVLMITDPNFAAGVVSQKNHVYGTLKGKGGSVLSVENVPNEQTVEQGEKFFTAGNDLIFPRGLPVGTVAAAREGLGTKEIVITPSGFDNGFEDVLVVIDGVHGDIPQEPVNGPLVLLPPAPPDSSGVGTALNPAATGPMSTEADRIMGYWREFGRQTGHEYGRGGSAPNFNRPITAPTTVAPASSAPKEAPKQ